MKKSTLFLSAIGTALFAGALFVQDVSARSVNACLGNPDPPTDWNWQHTPCDTGGVNSGVGVRWNTTSITVGYVEWTLPIDTSKSYNVKIYAAENGSSDAWVQCVVRSLNASGVKMSNDVWNKTINTTGVQTLSFTTSTRPAGGTIYVVCELTGNNTSKVLSFEWN